MSASLRAGAPEPVAGEPVAATRPRRGRILLVAAVTAGLAGGAWYGLRWWTQGRFVETTDDAYVGGNVTPLAPHVAGFVQAIPVADNARVRAGDLLVRIDPRDAQASLAHDDAVLAGRRAAADGLRAQVELERATIRQDEADLAAKTARAAFAGQDALRYASLVQTSAGSRQDAQRSTSVDQEAQATVRAAAATLDAARQKLHVLEAQIAEADAAAAQAGADVAAARLDLGYTEIRAPIDGIVGNRAAQVGAYVKQGTYLISVIPADGLWVDANFKEDQLARVRTGQNVEVTADVLPGHVFRGHVASLSPGTGAVFSVIPPENATGNFTKIVQRVPVRVTLDGGDAWLALLRPGLSTTVEVDTHAQP